MSIHREGMEKQEKLRVIVALYHEMMGHFTQNKTVTKKQYVQLKNKAKETPVGFSNDIADNIKFIYVLMKNISECFYQENWKEVPKYYWVGMHDIHLLGFQKATIKKQFRFA